VKQLADGLTDRNPYLGELTEQAQTLYREALTSGVDEEVVGAFEGQRAIGRAEFASTLKMERGRYRVRRGRPAKKGVGSFGVRRGVREGETVGRGHMAKRRGGVAG
jgi:hypothetical protein